MNFSELVQRLRRKVFKPKVYALSLEFAGIHTLVVRAGYRLEDVVKEGRQVFYDEIIKGGVKCPSAECISLGMYVDLEIEELFESMIDTDVRLLDKNVLMERIVTSHDTALYNSSKDKFTKAEAQYIEEKLTEKPASQ